MRRLWKGATLAAAALIAAPALMATAASAQGTPPSGYGYDNTSHTILGGGSDTTYVAMQNLATLYDRAPGCDVDTAATSATLNECVTPSSDSAEGGNHQRDFVGNLNPTGSGAGRGSLECNGSNYEGAINTACGGGKVRVDFARSSSAASGTELGGGTPGSNTVTQWGFAQDGVQILTFNNRALNTINLDATTVFKIYTCQITLWSQIPGWSQGTGSADGPIAVWAVNQASGTRGTFDSWVKANADLSSFPGWTGVNDSNFLQVDGTQGTGTSHCVRTDASNNFRSAFENDVKNILTAPPSLSTSASSPDNPENWLWFGSFGEMSAFTYKSRFTASNNVTYQAAALSVNGILPSTSNILAYSYPISRTLFHVTRDADAGCPAVPGNATAPYTCDFSGGGGPTLSNSVVDLNVPGASSGSAGAVREFTRWLCRQSTQQPQKDPYTGANEFNAQTSAINAAGYTTIGVSRRSAGSRCHVET